MMSIFVYSGEDLISSRKAFLEHLEGLKKKDYEVIRLNGKNLSEETLEQASAPSSLFGQKRVVAIENLLSGPKSKEKEKIVQTVLWLAQRSPDVHRDEVVVVWEGKDFSKADQLKYPDFIFKNFKLPPVLFSFLDSFVPGRSENNLGLLQKALESTDPNFLFLMLIRQIRLLIMASDKKDLLKLAPWQKSKLQKQARFFSLDQLKEINQKLLQIDFQQKTSQTPYSLEGQLELLLAEI